MAPSDNRDLVVSEERPVFSRQDLELIQPAADVDQDILNSARQSIALGVFSREKAIQHFNLSPEEAAELAKPRPRRSTALQAVEAELEEIKALRKSDRSRYWSPEVQQREGELTAQRERLRAMPASARDGAGEVALPSALETRWQSQPGGAQAALGALRQRVLLGFDGADQADLDELREAFDADLDEPLQVEIADALSQDSGRWPKASRQEIGDFKALEHGAALMKDWGDKGPAMLGVALHEARYIMAQLDEPSQLKLHRWIDARSTTHKERIIRILVARAVRRTAIGASGRGQARE
jgi:hypothetical protein